MNPDLAPLAQPKKRKRSTWGYWLGLVILIGAIGFVLYGNLGQNLSYYVSPSQLKSQESTYQNKILRLGALVKAGSVRYDRNTFDLNFVATDGYSEYAVHYKGAIPDLFKEGMGVVVEGKLEGKRLEGTNLLVKHSESYTAPKPGQTVDPKSLIEDAQP